MGLTLSPSTVKEESVPLVKTSTPPLDIFLPLTYSLNDKNDKHVTVAIISGETVLSFTASNKRIILSYHLWNVMRTNMDHIRLALDKRMKISCILKDVTDSSKSLAVVKQMFGKWYVQICDARGNRISISAAEWVRFEHYIPCISRYILQLWRDQPEIKSDINNFMHDQYDLVYPFHCGHWSDRLLDEVTAYKAISKTDEQSVSY